MSHGLNRAERREAARYMAKESAKYPAHLVQVPPDQWPERVPPGLAEVWRSRDYLVQVFAAQLPCAARLSVNRIAIAGDRWQDGIAWEDLQRLKGECGFPHHDAVEVFPAQGDVVNVANMRHLWVMADPLAFAWRAKA